MADETKQGKDAKKSDTAAAPTKEKRADETIPGGKYANPDGSLKNAHGKPIDEKGNVVKSPSAPQKPAPVEPPAPPAE